MADPRFVDDLLVTAAHAEFDPFAPSVGEDDAAVLYREDVALLALASASSELLDLRERIAALEAENRALRSQVKAQRQLLELMQAEALEAAPPRADRAASQPYYEAPLLLAANRGDADMVRLLISEGAADAGVHGDAALLLAAQGGHMGVALALLDSGSANVHVDLDSPLLWAAKRGDSEMTGLLLSHGADPTALRACAMRLAIAGGHADVVRALAGASRERRGKGA